MRVIINQPRSSYFVGGGELISFDHAKCFLELGNEVYFITISPKSIGQNYSKQYREFCKKYKSQIKIIEIDQDPKCKYIYDIVPGEDRCRWNIESIFYNKVMYNYLLKEKIVFDAMISYYNLDAVFVPDEYVLKNVLYLCGVPKMRDDYQGSFLSAYDKVFAITKEVKQYWQMYARHEIKVVTTGVDYERFSLKDFPNSDEINVLYVGRLIARKNVHKIILAVDKLKEKYNNLKLTIVGDGVERNYLEGMSKDVKFTGVVKDTEKYYKNADIFVSPSEYGEGVQGTVLEAMSTGLTVVATKSLINSSLLGNGRGVLVDPTVESVADGIEKAIKLNRLNAGKKARNYIIKNYNWLDKTREIYEEII